MRSAKVSTDSQSLPVKECQIGPPLLFEWELQNMQIDDRAS